VNRGARQVPPLRVARRCALLALALALGCSGASNTPRDARGKPGSPQAGHGAEPGKPGRTAEQPPPSGPARPFAFPKPTWSELPSGLRVAAVESKALPIVQLRVVVLAGKRADGERPGLASLTGELLKDGGAGTMASRELLTRIESLGGSLTIDTGVDRTVLGLAVTKDAMAEALGLLATIVQKPRFDAPEFGKLKKREIERVADAARTSGRWGASMVLWRELFTMPAERHPYATYDAAVSDLERLTLIDCRTFHQRFFVPKNTFVVVAGDVTPAAAKEAVDKAFTGFKGGEPPHIAFTDPVPPSGRPITLVHRPKSKQSDIYAAVLGPARKANTWPEMAVANQVLGGGVSGRLFLDVREKQSLAYNTRSTLVDVAAGPAPLVAYVGTQTAKTGLAVKALLDHLRALGTTQPSKDEVEAASRYLADVLAIRIETIGAVADEVANLKTLGLPDDYYDGYRKELREVTPVLAAKVASEHVRDGHSVVVVAGDADKIGTMLSRFGEVKVVDPAKSFERIRTIPKNPEAPLEMPREAGE
jgi:predicted Zn-dependent peptidase